VADRVAAFCVEVSLINTLRKHGDEAQNFFWIGEVQVDFWQGRSRVLVSTAAPPLRFPSLLEGITVVEKTMGRARLGSGLAGGTPLGG
jgi:hypothetical protein